MKHHRLIALSTLLAIQTASAGPLEVMAITDRSRDTLHLLGRDERDPDLAVEIETAAVLTPRDMTRLAGFGFRLAPGVYSANHATLAGQAVLLVTVHRVRGSVPAPETSSPGTFSCTGPYLTFLAVDPRGGQVADTLVEYAGGCPHGKTVLRWGPRYTSSTPLQAVRRSALAQADADAAARTRALEEQAAEIQRQKRQDESDRPAKLEIGARLCRFDGNFVETGYTEAVSPSGRKIQVRIVDHSYRGEGRLRPGGWSPTIMWDVPEAWRLCESRQ